MEYCRQTGITPIDLISSLLAEIKMLNISLEQYANEYKIGGSITDDIQRWRASIIFEIRTKIDNKTSKVNDIRKEFNLNDGELK